MVHSGNVGHNSSRANSCSVVRSGTWSQAVKLLLDGLLRRLQHQVSHVQDLDGSHRVLVHLHLWLRPVHGDGVTPELDTT